jgi:hypothetical protein
VLASPDRVDTQRTPGDRWEAFGIPEKAGDEQRQEIFTSSRQRGNQAKCRSIVLEWIGLRYRRSSLFCQFLLPMGKYFQNYRFFNIGDT